MSDYNLTQSVNEPTQTAYLKHKKTKEITSSSTLIDVLISNGALINSSKVLGFLFSDHKFVSTSINLPAPLNKPNLIYSRNLNQNNINTITNIINLNQDNFNTNIDTEARWLKLKSTLLNTIDSIAPLKTKNIQIKLHGLTKI